MRHSLSIIPTAALAFALGAPAVYAQHRNEEIVGKIERVDGSTIIVRRDGGAEVRINVASGTEVHFQDAGDRKMFPNPTTRDLKEGMGVRFNYNEGNPTRVVVHFVPASTGSGTTTTSSSQQVKARVQAVSRGGLEIRADVAGTPRTYTVADAATSRAIRRGDLVVLTVEDRGGVQTITRIDRAESVGDVVRVSGRTVVLSVDGREETYTVDDEDLLDNVRAGQRVRFEVEERTAGRRVITALRRE